MKTIGVLGCTFPATNNFLYLLHNESRRILPEHSNPPVVMFIDDFKKYAHEVNSKSINEWQKIAAVGVNKLKQAGADFVVYPANSTQLALRNQKDELALEFIDITEPVIRELTKSGTKRAGILGTSLTIEQNVYNYPLREECIELVEPESTDQVLLDRLIREELINGKITREGTEICNQIIKKLLNRGAQQIILGCTEISLLIEPTEQILDSNLL